MLAQKCLKAATVETFSRQMYVYTHTHTHGRGVHTHTHTHWHSLTLTHTHTYTHTHTHWLLEMWVTGPCSPSSVRKQSRSLLCSPTASARYKKEKDTHTHTHTYTHRLPISAAVLLLHNPLAFRICIFFLTQILTFPE